MSTDGGRSTADRRLRDASPWVVGFVGFALVVALTMLVLIPFAISLVLMIDVWREPFDLARALVPMFTAVPFAAAVWGRSKIDVEERVGPEVALAP